MTTVVEPEWDDDTRSWAEGLAEHDRAVCPGCGLHHVVIHDPDTHLQLLDDYCPSCRTLDAYKRKVGDRDAAWEKNNPNAASGAARPNDGLHIGLRSATPAEVRAGQRAQRRREQASETERPKKSQRPRVNRRG